MTAGLCIAGGLGVVAVIEDLRRRRVPNWLTAAGAGGGLACAASRRLARARNGRGRRRGGISGAAALPFVRRHGRRRRQADGRLRSPAGAFGDLAGGAVRGTFWRLARGRRAAVQAAQPRHSVRARHRFGSVGQSAGWRFLMHFDRRFLLVISSEPGLGAGGVRSVLPAGRRHGRPRARRRGETGSGGYQAASRGKHGGSRAGHPAQRARETVPRGSFLAPGGRAGPARDRRHTGGRAAGGSAPRGQRQRRGSGAADSARDARHLGARQRRGGGRRASCCRACGWTCWSPASRPTARYRDPNRAAEHRRALRRPDHSDRRQEPADRGARW